MNVLVEIIVYLLVVLGLITTCMTFFEKIKYADSWMYRDKLEKRDFAIIKEGSKDSKITVTIELENMDQEIKEELVSAIYSGKFEKIYNVADNVCVKNKNE